jgi:hypothetical protein
VSNRGEPNVNLDEVKYKMYGLLAFLGDIQPKVNDASLWLGLLNKYFSVTPRIDSNSASVSWRRVLIDLILNPDPSKGVSSSLPVEPNGFTGKVVPVRQELGSPKLSPGRCDPRLGHIQMLLC